MLRLGFWSGRIVCSVLGFVLGGPFLAVLGFFIGRRFDRALQQLQMLGVSGTPPFEDSAAYVSGHSRLHPIFLKVSFQVMGLIAKADAVVTRQSIKVAQSIMEDLHLDPHQRTLAMDSFNEGKQSDFSLEEALQTLSQTRLLEKNHWVNVFVSIQQRMVQADGVGSANKRHIFSLIAESVLPQAHWDFPPFYGQHAFHETNQGPAFGRDRDRDGDRNGAARLDRDYVTLNVNASASRDEVKLAYKRLMSQYHPDKLIAKKASVSAIRAATEKTQMIKGAYERICKARGF